MKALWFGLNVHSSFANAYVKTSCTVGCSNTFHCYLHLYKRLGIFLANISTNLQMNRVSFFKIQSFRAVRAYGGETVAPSKSLTSVLDRYCGEYGGGERCVQGSGGET
jgi:hypothetical protein